jgi:hypothetical protein
MPAGGVRDPRLPLRAGAAVAFGAAMRAAFAEAAEAAGTASWILPVGPERIALRFAGEALARELVPAFPRARRADDEAPGAAGTEVLLWDTASTGVACPPLPWRTTDLRPRGDVAGFNDERFGALWTTDDPDDPAARQMLSVFDARERTGLVWAPRTADLHWWERAAPLRAIVRWAWAGAGRTLVHGAAIGDGDAGVLLAGAGGAGKTSTTLAGVLSGRTTAGDDYVALDARAEPVVHGVYGGAKVEARTLALLPGLAGAVRVPAAGPGEKAVVDIARAWPGRWRDRLALRGLVIPVLAPGGPTRVGPASGGEALFALAPSTIGQLPGDRASLATMATLARRVPAFRLEIGRDPAEAARALEPLLAELR